MRQLWIFPILAIIVVLQTSIVSRIQLLAGFGDITLVILAAWALQPQVTTSWHWAVIAGLLTGFISAVPFWLPLVAFLLVVLSARMIQRRVWETPLLAMFLVTFAGTVILHLITYLSLTILGSSIPLGDVFSQITLPSVLINLILCVPVYAWIRDLASWLNPVEELV